MSPVEFIRKISNAAVRYGKQYDVPASLLIAQAALESRWGNSALATRAFNLGGMKAIGNIIPGIWDGETYSSGTIEYIKGVKVTVPGAKFRKYKNWEQSIEDIAHRHAIRFKRTLSKFAGDIPTYIYNLINTTGYATDPKYYSKITDLIEKYNLEKFDRLETIPEEIPGKKKVGGKETEKHLHSQDCI